MALAAGAFVMALNANVMAALLPHLDFDPEQKKVLVGSAGVSGAVGALLLGPLVDRYGRRGPMVIGMIVFSLASLAHVFARGFDDLLWARAVTGFAAGVVYTSASAAVADLVPYERRGKAMGVFTAGMFLGLPVGLPLAGLCAEYGDWRWVYYLQAGVGLVAVFATFRTLPPGLGKGANFFANLPRLASLQVGAALLSVMFYVGAFFTAVQFAGQWLDQTGLLPKQTQWSVWLILGLCAAVGSLTLGRVADRIGKWRWTNITTLLVAAGLLGLTQVTGIAGLLLVGVPLAVFSAARTGPFQALISELVSSETRGTLMGIRAAAVNLGTGLFPLLAFPEYRDTLYLASAGVLLAFTCQLVIKKR